MRSSPQAEMDIKHGTDKQRKMIAAGVAASVVASLGTAGIANAMSSTVGSKVQDAIRRNLSPRTLSPASGARVVIESVSLPPGQWILSSKESIVNFGPSDYVRCGLVGTADINWATSMVGDPNQPGAQGPGALVATMNNIGSVTSAVP